MLSARRALQSVLVCDTALEALALGRRRLDSQVYEIQLI